MSRSRSVVILNRADSCHLEQCLILVTIDAASFLSSLTEPIPVILNEAGGGVKDLEAK